MEEERKKTNTTLIVVLSVISLVILGIVYIVFVSFGRINQGKQEAFLQNEKNDRYFLNHDYQYRDDLITKVPKLEDMLTGPIITSMDPSIGEKNSKVVIVIFSDFECEYCIAQEKIIKEILEEYQNKIRFVWKDYPERDPSSISYQAALAARCAQKQDKFWEYHDELYLQEDMDSSSFQEIAEKINLRLNDFKTCFNTMQTAALINDNIEEANALDIEGVPFIYINDQELMGGASKEDLIKIIEIEFGN